MIKIWKRYFVNCAQNPTFSILISFWARVVGFAIWSIVHFHVRLWCGEIFSDSWRSKQFHLMVGYQRSKSFINSNRCSALFIEEEKRSIPLSNAVHNVREWLNLLTDSGTKFGSIFVSVDIWSVGTFLNKSCIYFFIVVCDILNNLIFGRRRIQDCHSDFWLTKIRLRGDIEVPNYDKEVGFEFFDEYASKGLEATELWLWGNGALECHLCSGLLLACPALGLDKWAELWSWGPEEIIMSLITSRIEALPYRLLQEHGDYRKSMHRKTLVLSRTRLSRIETSNFPGCSLERPQCSTYWKSICNFFNFLQLILKCLVIIR